MTAFAPLAGSPIAAPAALAVLTPADAAHAHTADAASLTAAALLAIADALHTHSAAGVVLTPEAVLAIADALHAHAADPVSLDTQQTLVIADGLHAHTSDGVALTATAVLVPASALHGHTAAVAVLSLPGDAVWPDPSQVLLGVVYGPTGADYTGTLVPGANADEVAAAVWAYATRSLTVTAEVNVKQVNDVPLAGSGVPGSDPWRPA